MTFDDFLEFFSAKLRKYRDAIKGGNIRFGTRVVKPVDFQRFLDKVSEAHIFLMGAEVIVRETLRDLSEDLLQDMAGSLPMPFDNLSMVSQDSAGKWKVDWLYRPGGPRNADPNHELFFYVPFTEAGLREDLVHPWLGALCDFSKRASDGSYNVAVLETPWEGSEAPEPGPPPPASAPSSDGFPEALAIAGLSLMSCAALSHPYLYVVEAQPELTPRERRQTEKRGHLPDRKRPRFIVVDRTGFEDLRRPALGGTHAPPIAHERKGHWRRLSERCVQARAEGRTRTFVRDAVVGATAFRDERATYQLVLDPAKLRTSVGTTKPAGGIASTRGAIPPAAALPEQDVRDARTRDRERS